MANTVTPVAPGWYDVRTPMGRYVILRSDLDTPGATGWTVWSTTHYGDLRHEVSHHPSLKDAKDSLGA